MSFITSRPIAHRGLHDGNKKIYENSMSAFTAAVDAGYSIELDVQLSSDGIAMVYHDRTLERLTSSDKAVRDLTAEELQKIKLGKTRDVIDTLEDVLLEIDGGVPVIIEMKFNKFKEDTPLLARAVADDLSKYKGDAAVMSFRHSLIKAFTKTGSTRPIGLTAEGIKQEQLEKHFKAVDLGIKFVSYNVVDLPNAFIDEMRTKYELPIITWTVETPEHVTQTANYADQMTFQGFLA